MQAKVETTIIQWIEVPEGTDQQDVFNFLAEHQSFRDSFVGVSDPEQTMRITDIEVVLEEVLEISKEDEDEEDEE
jgi:hypothetical protein